MTENPNDKQFEPAIPNIEDPLLSSREADGETLAESMADLGRGDAGADGAVSIPKDRAAVDADADEVAPEHDLGDVHREGAPEYPSKETLAEALAEEADGVGGATLGTSTAQEQANVEVIADRIDEEEETEADEAAETTEMITLTINDIPVTVPLGSTVLEAALAADIRIPTLCYLKGVNAIGSCRMCVVEVKGARTLVASCVYPAADGMEVRTDTEQVRQARKLNMELILSNHRMDCLTCERSNNCELRTLAADLGVDELRFKVDDLEPDFDTSAQHLIRDNSKCILCRRCVAVCHKQEQVGVIGPIDRGYATHIGSEYDRGLGEVSCVACGQCIEACPTGALTIKRHSDEVLEAIADPEKIVVAMTAPSVRVGLGDEFGIPIGTNVEGKMVTALRRLGFDLVFDVDWGADSTIIEESTELMERIQEGRDLPVFTSCCPAWIRYMEFYHHDMLNHLSTARSPLQEIASILKTYYAGRENIDPKNIVAVTIMPCTAKKYEILREQHRLPNGLLPTDYSLTTRELSDMITNAGILFDTLPDGDFDKVLGESTGAGDIFGASGGVMEAALRTAVAKLSGSDEDAPLEFKEVRGEEGIKEAEYTVGDVTLHVCALSTLSNAEKMIQKVRSGEKKYDFVEVMACPGGCVNGGGQPIHSAFEKMVCDIPHKRAAGLYQLDASKKRRRSDENEEVMAVYRDYIGEPGGIHAHELLHTHYDPMERFPKE